MTILEERTRTLLYAGPLTAGEIALNLHLARSTVANILSSLQQLGVVKIAWVRNRGVRGGSGRGTNVYALAEPSR